MIPSPAKPHGLHHWLVALRRRLPEPFGGLVPRSSFLACTEFCGTFDLGHQIECLAARDRTASGKSNFDWSDNDTTPDQLRIEQVLATLNHHRARALHVGVGDSGFAQRWHDKVGEIVGITVSTAEQLRAEELGLPNYRCYEINKYDRALTQLPGSFEFIIDNNPTIGACCKFHFFTMWLSYCILLKPCGTIMSDIDGMRWVLRGSDLRWSLDDRDLAWIAKHFRLVITRAGQGNRVRLLTA
jgi:hypothetical protein